MFVGIKCYVGEANIPSTYHCSCESLPASSACWYGRSAGMTSNAELRPAKQQYEAHISLHAALHRQSQNSCPGHAMPRLKKHNTNSVAKAAKKWHRSHKFEDVDSLTIEERRDSEGARAAFFMHKLAIIQTSFPTQIEPCGQCGEPTTAWCEGCYLRCSKDASPYGAICNTCDREMKVCEWCDQAGITYAAGHLCYLQTLPGGVEEPNTMQVLGYTDQDGEMKQLQTPVHVHPADRPAGRSNDPL